MHRWKRCKKIDTSELLRVFGAFKAVHHEQIDNVTDEQHVTPNRTGETSKTKQLEHEIEHLRQLVTAQQSHIDSLKQAMLLIESKLPTTREPVTPPVGKNHGNSGRNSAFSRQTGWSRICDSDNKLATPEQPVCGQQNPWELIRYQCLISEAPISAICLFRSSIVAWLPVV